MSHSYYYDLAHIDAVVEQGGHRDAIGGLWDQMGEHQLAFLISQGMTPDCHLLDVGCGSLRLGVKAIEYLNEGRYFGSDISKSLIYSGYERELSDGQRAKVSLSNFGINEDFDFEFLSCRINFAIAQSVFTHLPLNHLRRCLYKLHPHMTVGGKFFVTYFECEEGADLFSPIEQPHGGVTTYDYKDPFHYRMNDLVHAVDRSNWRLNPIGEWGHPRGQRIACFERL